jgi:hypothetical protein
MYLLPFERITFLTKLSESEIFNKLSNEYVEPYQFKYFYVAEFQPKIKPYVGTVDRQGFTIRRNVPYHSPSIPHIKGKFERNGESTKVIITMRFHYNASIGLASFFLFILYLAISSNDFTFLPIMAAFYFVFFIWFRLEVSKSKEDLQNYLEVDSSLS